MPETERKLHILTPLLWPSRCVILVLLDAQPEVLGSTPSGLFRGPPRSGEAFPTTSGLYCLEVCWQLHRGFPRSPSVGCGLPYHIWSLALWESAGNCFGGFSECPLGQVWPSLPHLVSTVWKSAGNCIGGFRGPPRSGVGSLPHLVSNPLGVCWQLHRGFPRSPSVGCTLPYHITSLTLWESAGNCIGGFREPPQSGVAFPTTSGL